MPRHQRSDERRNQAGGPEKSELIFVNKGISQERLAALRDFLEHATADDIATIRRFYGDNPEVLKMIGIEMPDQSQ